jgi:hypothetical protein
MRQRTFIVIRRSDIVLGVLEAMLAALFVSAPGV